MKAKDIWRTVISLLSLIHKACKETISVDDDDDECHPVCASGTQTFVNFYSSTSTSLSDYRYIFKDLVMT